MGDITCVYRLSRKHLYIQYVDGIWLTIRRIHNVSKLSWYVLEDIFKHHSMRSGSDRYHCAISLSNSGIHVSRGNSGIQCNWKYWRWIKFGGLVMEAWIAKLSPAIVGYRFGPPPNLIYANIFEHPVWRQLNRQNYTESFTRILHGFCIQRVEDDVTKKCSLVWLLR